MLNGLSRRVRSLMSTEVLKYVIKKIVEFAMRKRRTTAFIICYALDNNNIGRVQPLDGYQTGARNRLGNAIIILRLIL